jgi:hypothetical protein
MTPAFSSLVPTEAALSPLGISKWRRSPSILIPGTSELAAGGRSLGGAIKYAAAPKTRPHRIILKMMITLSIFKVNRITAGRITVFLYL